MDAGDIISLVLGILNTSCVLGLSINSISRDKQIKKANKKKAWYNSEVISEKKIQDHLQKLEKALTIDDSISETDDTMKMVIEVNNCMLDFFYCSLDYIRFIDVDACKKIKRDVMAAIDEILLRIAFSSKELTTFDKNRMIKIYRVKLIQSFYEIDMLIDNIS